MNYDGNGHVLASYEHRMADIRDEADPNEVSGSVAAPEDEGETI